MLPSDGAFAEEAAIELPARFEELLRESTNVANAKAALKEAQSLSDRIELNSDAQSFLLQIREKAGDTASLLADVEALFRTRTDDLALLELFLRRLIKIRAQDRALEELDAIYPSHSTRIDHIEARAKLLYRIHAYEAGDAAFAQALAIENNSALRVIWAKLMAKRFLYEDAGIILDGCTHAFTGDKIKELAESISVQRNFYRRFYPDHLLKGKDFRVLAMEQAVLHYVDRELPTEQAEDQRVHLVTGSLGAGGAERQLCGLAQLIKAQKPWDREISDVEVIVKEHVRAGVSDFFLEGLEGAGVAVHQINDMKPVSASNQDEMDPDLAHFMGMLPPQVHYGVVRLSPHWRKNKPDVASIWQDGACLFGALAALFAGITRIQMVFRGLPPNIRQHRGKPEYAPLYQALARVPGVEFVCNSHIGAKAYADWLDLPLEQIHVLYNGVAQPRREPYPSDEQIWEEFAARTTDATETIGGVFRFEPDKGPLDWIRVAAAYAEQRPKTRFVIVGDGRLIQKAQDLVEQLNLSDRMLFAGSSKAVGFWYSKMDVKLLMSRFEGLPNVLIEAQYLGCPVVSTPAGGAAECFEAGRTGYVLDCAEHADVAMACDRIRTLVDARKANPDDISSAALTVAKQFSPRNMLEHFHAICRLNIQSKRI